MTKSEHQKLMEIATDKPWLSSKLLLKYLETAEIVEEPKGNRTGQQNKALHKGFELVANALNDAGLDIRAVMKESVEIPWTPGNVKEYLFKPVMRIMLHKESTRDLEKTGEIERVWDVVLRHLQQNHGIDYIDFPHFDQRLTAMDNLKRSDYPEYTGEVKF